MEPVKLHPHQEKAVEKLGNGKILCGATGVGKSITAMAYFVSKVCGGTYGDFGSMRTPKDIYIITTAKKRDSLDWESEAIKFGISSTPNNSVAGIKLTVDSWNNIKDYLDVKDAFFIFDEQRSVGSGSWAQSLIKIAKRNEWILLSATPGDTWIDYITVFVANGWYKNRTEFKRRHVVYSNYGNFPKIDRYLETGTLVKRRNQILVDMPYERHTVRHGADIKVDFDKELFDKVVNDRWHVYEQRPLRDVGEMFIVMRKVANSDSSRLDAIRSLMNKHQKLIVFYNFDYELDALRSLGESLKTSSASSSTTPSGTGSSDTTDKKKPSTWLSPTERNDATWKTDERSLSPSTPISPSSSSGLSESDAPVETPSPSGSTTSEATRSKSSTRQPNPLEGTIWDNESAVETLRLSLMTESESSSEKSSRKMSGSATSTSSTSNTTSSVTTSSVPQTAHGATSGPAKTTSVSTTDGPSGTFAIAEWNGHKHEKIPETDSWIYLVQYTAGSEGWNCVETDAMVFYSLTYSWKAFWQAHGRIDRLNTPFVDLWYYSLVSDSFIDKAIRKSLKAKRSFNEREHYGLIT